MARIVVTAPADADTAAILADLASEAGLPVAIKYNGRFERLYVRLAEHPSSGSPRPKLGPCIRIGVVWPYIVVYRYDERDDVVNIIRIVHGRRRITRNLVRGAS